MPTRGVPPWAVPPVSGYKAWFDASDEGSIIAVATAVSKLFDKSGNGHHLVQATGNKQPLSGTRLMNGLNVLDFDGVNDNLQCPDNLALSTTTIFVTAQLDNAAAFPFLFDGIGSGRNAIFARPSAPWERFAGTEVIGANNSNTSPHVHAATFSHVAGDGHWLDGTLQATGDAGSDVLGDFYLGSDSALTGAPSLFWDGTVGELLIYGTVLSVADRQRVETYLKDKWITSPSRWPAGSPTRATQRRRRR